MKILFFGRQSHASAPEDGQNPAQVIAETVLHIGDLLSKKHKGMVLCTITGIEAGSGDFGISAGEGSISVTLRASEESELLEMEEEIREMLFTVAVTSRRAYSFLSAGATSWV